MKYWLLALAIVLVLAGCATQQQAPENTGRVVFAVTDAAVDLGTINSIMVTFDRLQVQSTNGSWQAVLTSQNNFDLLQLKSQNIAGLLADANLPEGSYNQLRIDVTSVQVTDAQGNHNAKLPSNQLRINSNFEVASNHTATVTLDFKADESLHVTGNGEYIMAPVVHVETRQDAEVNIREGKVDVKGGRLMSDTKVGMDVSGKVGEGISIPKDSRLSIENGIIKSNANVSGKPQQNISVNNVSAKGRIVVAATDPAPDMGVITGVYITVGSVKAHTQKGWLTISNSSSTFNLMQLSSESSNAVIADAKIVSDEYDQLWLNVTSVIVKDDKGDHDAKLPSNELKLNALFKIKPNSTSTALLDFNINKSLHVTGAGEYVLAPVLKVETRDDASVDVKSGKVNILEGKVRTSEDVAMDVTGNVGRGFTIKDDDIANISGRNHGKINQTIENMTETNETGNTTNYNVSG